MKKLLSLFMILIVCFFFSSSAFALPVGGLFNTNGAGTLLSDNSADLLINVNSDPTKVDVGDILLTIAGIGTIGGTTIGGTSDYNEMTFISAVKISDAVDVDFPPLSSTDDSGGTQNIDLWSFTAVPLTAAEANYFDWSTGTIDLDGNPTTNSDQYTFDVSQLSLNSNDGSYIGAAWEDSSNDYTRSGTIQAGLDSTSNGNARFEIGFVDPADFLSVIAPLDITDFLTIPEVTAVDNASISLDATILAAYFPGLIFNENITGGNGGFSSPENSSEWPIYDNIDFTVTATAIPEPSSILLLGAGLVGLAGFGRMRSRKEK